tara:strand:- start:64 stop:1386 length:1323 start_codon:yes stop_codon:yes gene_type:complete
MSPLTRRGRTATAVTLGLATTVLVSGCAGAAGSAAGSFSYEQGDEPVELTFWTAAVEDVNQELVDQFNESRGAELGIQVTAEYQGDYVQTEQKVNASAVADTLPNLFVDEVGMTQRFADSNITVSLTPYLEAAGMDDADFQVGETGNLYVGEDMYAFPHMRSVPVMYVNRDMMRELGLKEDGPETFVEFESYLEAAAELVGGPAMIFCDYDFWVMEALFYSYGGTAVLNDDESESTIDSAGAVATVEWIADLEDRGLIKVTSAADVQAFFAASGAPTTAFTFLSSGGIQSIRAIAEGNGVDIGVSLIPAGEGDQRGVSVGGSNVYLANTGTDNEKAAAFEFMTWLSDTEQTAYASSRTGYLPVRLSAFDTDTMLEMFDTIPGYSVAAEQIQYGKARPMPKAYSELEQLMIERIHAIYFDDLDAQAALTDLAAEVDAVLSR